jgi:hypothetical protein
MALFERGKEKVDGALLPRTARAKLEEYLGKLEITDEDVTPLVIDDHDEGAKRKCMLAGKVLYHYVFHIQTISSALFPAWVIQRVRCFDMWEKICS